MRGSEALSFKELPGSRLRGWTSFVPTPHTHTHKGSKGVVFLGFGLQGRVSGLRVLGFGAQNCCSACLRLGGLC